MRSTHLPQITLLLCLWFFFEGKLDAYRWIDLEFRFIFAAQHIHFFQAMLSAQETPVAMLSIISEHFINFYILRNKKLFLNQKMPSVWFSSQSYAFSRKRSIFLKSFPIFIQIIEIQLFKF